MEWQTRNVSVFAAGEYLAWNNSGSIVSGRGGIRIGFEPAAHCAPSQAGRLALSCVPTWDSEEIMKKMFGRLAGALLALAMTSGLAAAQSKITIAVGGGLPVLSADGVGKTARRI